MSRYPERSRILFRKQIAAGMAAALLISGCGSGRLSEPEAEAELPGGQSAEAAWVDQALDPFLNDGGTLPTETGDGASVAWSVTSGHAAVQDGVITKTEGAAEYEPVTLHAVISLNGTSEEADYDHLLLLDPYIGYVMSTFSEKGDSKEELKLAYTYDETTWFKLKGGDAIFSAKTGTKRVRDPAIFRKKDGTFALVATEGYDNPSIYVWDSADGTSYQNERLIQVNRSSDSLKMSEKQAWAPEAFYDRRKDAYVVYWSSPSDGGMFYNTSGDLTNASLPRQLLDAGFTVIDGTIFKQGYYYSIVMKDEREPLSEHAQLFIGKSDTDYLGFNQFTGMITDGKLEYEGPFVVQRWLHGDTLIYYDNYTQFQFKAVYTWDMHAKDVYEFEQDNITPPIDYCAHAYAIPVTEKELNRLKDTLGAGE